MRIVNFLVYIFLVVGTFIAWLKDPFMPVRKRKEARLQSLKKYRKKQKKQQLLDQPIDLTLDKSGLSSEELFALSLGDLAFAQAPEIKTKGALLDTLKKQWGMSFAKKNARDRVFFSLRHLWSEGNTKLLIRNTEFIESTNIRDLVAYDTGLFVLQVHRARALELIDNEQAWGMLFLNAQRAQDCYNSWNDFFTAYTKGFLCWKAISKNESPEALTMFREKLFENKEYSKLIEAGNLRSWPKLTIFDNFIANDQQVDASKGDNTKSDDTKSNHIALV